MFAHDTESSLQAAVALVNTAEEPDTLVTLDDLDEYYAAFSFTGRRDRDQAELEAVRVLRPLLRELLTSDREHAVTLVNTILAEARALPQLVRHEPFDWHLHAVPSDAPLPTRLAVEAAMAMIDLIRTDELSRLGTCSDDGCDGVVLDLTRNRSRRFCSVACGNRHAVAAYRARKATGQEPVTAD